MEKLFLILTFSLIFQICSGQTESAATKRIALKFEVFYNSEKYDSIFTMFSTEMAHYLPLDKTRDFFKTLNSQVGKITKRQFVYYQPPYVSYKTSFERAIFALNISIDNHSQINGLFIKPFIDDSLPKLERNITKLVLPFHDEWTVVWGGDTKSNNYHIENQAQKNAMDFVITDANGKSYQKDGQNNQDYYAFGKDIIAPCAGEVVLVVDGVKDNKPGVMNPFYISGNTIIIKTDKNEYLFFAHFQQNSIKVKQGQRVSQGQLLGFCGNSGNSSEAHLHFHIQNTEDMNIATGVKCFFDKIMVNEQLKTDYSPIKNDKIKINCK